MAEVEPFRALRYDEAAAGPLESLVAPPYDVISPDERDDLRSRSPYNVVHLTLPDSEAEAGRLFRDWRARGVLGGEHEPSFWALSQTYVGPDGLERTRTGLVATVRVEPYERRVILPHERTHRGPKEGRLRLLREVRAELEPIFLLYEGERPFDLPTASPDLAVEGTSLWRIGRRPELAARFARQQLLIADGHHRYETALAFHEEYGSEASAFMLAVLVSTQDPGLTIFPTHRLARGVDGLPPGEPAPSPAEALERLAALPPGRAAVVAYRAGSTEVLAGALGELDPAFVARLAPGDVTYAAGADEAVAAVDRGDADVAFLLRPMPIEEVFAVAGRGETMPQKSTYFYPKLVSGLLFQPL